MIAESLKADPQLSNLEHSRRTGASDKTVASVRSDLESHSEIPNDIPRINSRGQERPSSYERSASQPRREPVEPEPVVPEQTESVDESQSGPYSHRWEYGYCAPTALILGHERRKRGRWVGWSNDTLQSSVKSRANPRA